MTESVEVKQIGVKANKRLLSFVIALIGSIMLLFGCSGKSNKLIGTWGVDSVESDGTRFTVSELKAMGDDSMSDMQIVLKAGGKAYVSDGGSGDVVDWSETKDGVTIGKQKCTIVDDMICLEYGDGKVYFKKVSDSQTVGDPQKEDTSEPIDQSEESELEQTDELKM